jgi:hypothetical protein
VRSLCKTSKNRISYCVSRRAYCVLRILLDEHRECLICPAIYSRNVRMAKKEYSQYQKTVISGYYNNLDTIMLGKLSELVSELYLADTQAKRDRLWDRAHKAMLNLKIPPPIIDHIMQKKDVQILAKNLQDWLARKRK